MLFSIYMVISTRIQIVQEHFLVITVSSLLGFTPTDFKVREWQFERFCFVSERHDEDHLVVPQGRTRRRSRGSRFVAPARHGDPRVPVPVPGAAGRPGRSRSRGDRPHVGDPEPDRATTCSGRHVVLVPSGAVPRPRGQAASDQGEPPVPVPC